jgi:hypothetical protein
MIYNVFYNYWVDNFNVLQNDLAIFCWHRCCHQDDLLWNKDHFIARTFPGGVTEKTQHLMVCFCIWLERWLEEFGDDHYDWDICLWESGRPSYYTQNPFKEMDAIERALRVEDKPEDTWLCKED